MSRLPRARRSLAGRVALVVIVSVVAAAAATLGFDRLLDSPWLAGAAALLVILPPAIWLTGRALDRWSRGVRAVSDGISSLRDRDFSVSVTPSTGDEVGMLTGEYNS